MKAILLFVILASVLGFIGKEDQTTRLIENMQTTCQSSYLNVRHNDCYKLIVEVQSKGYEVISNNTGSYWAESK